MRKILITGSSRGIGNKITNRLLKDGHQVSIGIRNIGSQKNKSIKTLSSEYPKLIINEYEAKDPNSADRWVKEASMKFGSIDTIICSAGIFKRTPLLFDDDQEEEINELIKVNLMGPWYLTRASWAELSKTTEGRIIILSSMSGKRSKGNLAGYSVSKFALMGLCQTIRNQGWDRGIRVTTICPGWVNTDMSSNVNELSKEMMTQPEDIGELVSLLLKLPNSSVPFELAMNCMLEK